MKTTLWVQIIKTFTQDGVEQTQIENHPYESDTWEQAFTDASSAYFNKAWYLTADENVSWFKIQIVNKLMAVEHGMTAEWTRPIVPESTPTPESEG